MDDAMIGVLRKLARNLDDIDKEIKNIESNDENMQMNIYDRLEKRFNEVKYILGEIKDAQ